MAEDVDTLFPPQKGDGPDVDTLFPPDVERDRERNRYRAAQGASPLQDLIFGDETVSPVARILNAAGHGAANGWGAEPLGLSDQTVQTLRKWGLFNDYAKGEASHYKAVNEVLMRPAAVGLDALFRRAPAAFLGATLGGVVEEASILGEHIGVPSAGERLQTGIEVAQDPGLAASLQGMGPHGIIGAAALRAAQPALRFVDRARSLNIIGKGEAGWKGTAPIEEAKPPVAPPIATEKAAEAQPPSTATPPSAEAATPSAAASIAPDVTTVARGIAPDLFTHYDKLKQQESALRSMEEVAPSETVKQHLSETRAEIDKLAPDIQAAYREAAEQSGAPTIEPQAAAPAPKQGPEVYTLTNPLGWEREGETLRVQVLRDKNGRLEALDTPHGIAKVAPAYRDMSAEQAIAETFGDHLQGVPGDPSKVKRIEQQPAAPSIEAQRATIANDVAQKLIAAGRPAEEAQAAGAIMAARYETRAARFNGALGTAEELYRREGPEIRGAKPPATPSAGGVGPGEPPPRGPAPESAKIDATHDVVSGANSTKDPNGPVFIDRRIPELSPTLKDDQGNPVNLHNLLQLHERVEAEAMAQGLSYDRAHVIATAAERELARRTGIDFDAYTKEIDGFLAHIEKDKAENPPKADLHVDPEAAIGHHKSTNKKQKSHGEAPLVPQFEKVGMIENAEAYKQAAKDRRERYGGGGGEVFATKAAQDRAKGLSPKEAEAQHAARMGEAATNFDEGIKAAGVGTDEVSPEARQIAIEVMADMGFEPVEALDYAVGKIEHDAQRAESEPPFEEVYFQRKRERNLHAEREAQGQLGLPGTERISQAEVIQRKANAPLKPSVEQKPMDEGLFSDSAAQKELFQTTAGKVKIGGPKPIITLMRSADASTFIHESGHVFLEEMIRDAGHEAAPSALVADAKAVRDWLKAEEGQPLSRRAHEKFARGFEQYLREGVAPSPRLASAFARFRDWLLRIYQTIKGLGTEITPEIRGVFDRLLAEKPERTVIAPEVAQRPTLQDIHEADARLTEPHHAEAAADRVTTEAAKQAAELPETIADEHRRGAEETGSRPAEPGPLPEAGGASEPVAPSGGGGGEHGEVAPRGGEPLREGTRARTDEGGERPVGPHDSIPRSDTHFLDKAGNIRLDNLGTPEDVNAVIREAANENADFIAARRGVISDVQAIELADALGMDAAQLNTRRIGEAFNEEQIIAARKLLIQSATSVREAAAKAANGTEADLLAYAEAKQRHIMIQEQVSGITAEAGRAMRAFRSMEGMKEARALGDFLRDATGKTLFQLRREAQLTLALPTPQQVSRFMHDSTKPRFADMILEYWINNLISGPATHTTYAVGNALLALWKTGPETAVAAGIGVARHALGGTGERVYFGEVPAQMYGMMKGARDGVVAAWEAAKTGKTALLPGELENMTAKDLANSPLVNPKAAIPNFTVKGVPIPVGTFVRLPSRGVAMIHSFFRTVNYEREMAALAYRQAALEGLDGQAFAARIGEITSSPGAELMEKARVSATDLTLMGSGGEFTRALSRLTNAEDPLFHVRWLKFIDPFVHISSNVIEQAVFQRTPLGLLALFKEDSALRGAQGPAARDMAIARIAVGSTLGVAVGSLAAEGLINGSGPSDPKEKAIWTMVNGPPHSVRVGNTYYDIHRLGPLGMQVGIAADFYEVAHMIPEKGLSVEVAHALTHALTQNILDESFLRGPSDLIKALTDPDRYGASWIRNFASSFAPYSVGMGQVARAIDPYSRRAQTIIDSVKAKTPWLSETLLPRRDIFGEPIPNKSALGVAGLSAIYEQKVNNDPVPRALLEAGIFPAMPQKKIRGVELTDQQYDDYARIAGRTAKMRLNAIVAMPGYQQLPEMVRKELLHKAIEGAHETAQSMILMQNPDIIKKAMDAKVQKLTVH